MAVPGLDHLTSALSLQLQFANATFRAVLDARKAIYPILASEAAQNATHQDIAILRESLARLRDLTTQSAQATLEARSFNELVAGASSNLVLSYLVSALHRMSEHASVEYSANHWRAYHRHSTKMVEAIEAGDGESARRISMLTHEAGIRYWEKNFPDLLNEPITWVTDDQEAG